MGLMSDGIAAAQSQIGNAAEASTHHLPGKKATFNVRSAYEIVNGRMRCQVLNLAAQQHHESQSETSQLVD
jgi:hypothetical protein